MSVRRGGSTPQGSDLERDVRQVLSEAARTSQGSRHLLRGIERRCRKFLEEERWARITLRWSVVAGAILAVLLLLEQVGEKEPGPAPGPLAMDVGEYFHSPALGESEVLSSVVVGEVPE